MKWYSEIPIIPLTMRKLLSLNRVTLMVIPFVQKLFRGKVLFLLHFLSKNN